MALDAVFRSFSFIYKVVLLDSVAPENGYELEFGGLAS